MNSSFFKSKKVLITGGTGSFGQVMTEKLLDADDVSEIRILSRDEKKQEDMRIEFNNPKLKFFLGDVRDLDSLYEPIIGTDFIFHAAALKQVPSCEFFPMEAVKTNILGTSNVLDMAIKLSIKSVVCLSTDKAVNPVNAMGISKAMMEKLASAKSRESNFTKILITRYGNVMGSRGSVIPLFFKQIQNNEPLTVTDGNMTRFMMTLDEAVELVLFSFENGENGDIFVQKSSAANINTLIQAIKTLKNLPENYPVNIIGTRHGEKLYETLLSSEEMTKASNFPEYFRVQADQRSLNYDSYTKSGIPTPEVKEEYNSHNTTQLNTEELTKKIQQNKYLF